MVEVADQAIPVFVCDRQPLVCEGVTAILEREPDISVVGAATSLEEAIVQVRERRPTVVVVGHDPPHLDALALTRTLDQLDLGEVFPVVLVEFAASQGLLVRALQVGARGVLGKEQASVSLASTVRSLARGSVVVGPVVAGHLLQHLSHTVQPHVARLTEGRLSEREFQVLEYAARGLSNREIAEALSLSVATVKSHLHSLSRKLGLRDRVQVVILAYEAGIVRPSGQFGLDGATGQPKV